MTRLILGVLLWSIVHFIPALVGDFKKNMVERFGDYPYKGGFTLLMVIAIYLIISGWKAAMPGAGDLMYVLPAWSVYVTGLLVLLGFILFLAPYPENNFKRRMRHPQLIGMALWGLGHILSNGEPRSMVLFGGLTAWALIEMILINRRDGQWTRPDHVPFKKDVTLVMFSMLVFLTFLYTHHLIFSGSPLT